MTINERFGDYLLRQDGINKVFSNLGQVAATGALMKFVPLLAKTNIFGAILLVILSLLLLSLAAVYGIKQIIIPLMKTMYGEQEKFSEMETLGLKAFLNFQFAIYVGVSFIYLYLLNEIFNLVVKA